MPKRVAPIARIRLARSPVRLLAFPAVTILYGVATAVAFALGVASVVAISVGGLLALNGVLMAIRPLTARLDVEEAAVRLHWLGGERIYALTPGPVTRVRLRGQEASKLRSRSGGMGWILGAARLRDEEDIEAVRLAPTETAILVPTERGRLAIAAESEEALLDALTRAARARQRLDDLVAPPAAPDVPSAGEVADAEVDPHLLTGIERALMEERLAREREAGAASPIPAPAPEARPADATPRPEAAPTSRWRRARGSRAMPRLSRPRPSAALVLLPLVGAGIVWGSALALERLPEPGSDLGRLTSLGLVLGGPATSIGAVMARAWWPRLVGIVVTGGLAASVFVGRALLGP